MNVTDTDVPDQLLFANWRFDANTGDLFDGDSTTHLEPQVAKLLTYFLCHQDTLISRDELIAEAWENRTVSDDAINRCISILRRILSPDDKNAYIETVVRRGFISHFPPPPIAQARTIQPPRNKNYLIVAAFVVVSLIAIYFVVGKVTDTPVDVPEEPSQGTPKLAVLPFSTTDLDGDSDFFANGIHDDLLTQLAQLQSIQVISRTSVLEYRDTVRNLRDIGRELGVDAILEGGVQRVGDQIRINVQLIDASTDAHLWAQQYDRDLSPANIFEVQTEIARAIAAALHANLTEQDTSQLHTLPTQNMAAYRAYHRAMELRGTWNIADPAYFTALEEAVSLDPTFVRAWAELAGAFSYEYFSREDPDSIQRAEKILERIHELAPDSADYLFAQSYFTYYVLRDYPTAYQLVSHAQQLRPNDVRVAELKSWIQRRLGNYEERLDTLRLIRTLDPRSPGWVSNLAGNLTLSHRYDEAIHEIESSTFQNMRLASLLAFLQVQQHHDFDRWLGALLELQQEYGEAPDPNDVWEAQIAVRDFEAAKESVKAVFADNDFVPGWAHPGFAKAGVLQAITFRFLQDADQLDQLLIQGRSEHDEIRGPDGGFDGHLKHLEMAILSTEAGNSLETERLIRVWQRAAVDDLAEFINLRHWACRALGMAAASTAAVDCIRLGLVEPSLITPFIEPYLPYYDSMRNEPEFVGLVAEIESGEYAIPYKP